MKIIKKVRRSALVIVLIFLSVLVLTKCINDKGKKPKLSSGEYYKQFAGSVSCANCHKNIFDSHMNTGHYLTSQPVAEGNIKGSFAKAENEFYFNDFSKLVMEKRTDSFFQVAYIRNEEKSKSRFDIVIGSGKKGQSYLSWKKNSLIQMPVTYFTPESTWSSSPGFNPRRIEFNRVITSRCLECHSTFFQKIADETKHPEEFDRKNIVYGVDCEKCHGPARKHVDFHTTTPDIKDAKYIINTGKLTREAKLDLCALCHSGKLSKTQPSFSFQPGDKLSDYFSTTTASNQPGGIDVHGNQLGLLSQSKCFLQSDMTCQSCHNVHASEKGKLAVFSQKCITCHVDGKNKQCGLKKTEGDVINENCIDCHMPLQSSQSITVYLQGAGFPTPAKLRTHQIKIYKEETDKVLNFLRHIGNKEK
jgi:Cytochrome c554 and c-prime